MGQSLLIRLARLPEKSRTALLADMGIPPDMLLSDWRVLGRPEQLQPAGQWSTWLFMAGRGAGKTRSAAEWVHDRIIDHYERADRGEIPRTEHRIAAAGRSSPDVRDVIVEGMSGLVAIGERRGLKVVYEPSKRRLTWPDLNAQATTFTAEEPESARGPEHHTAWCDEAASWRLVADPIGNTLWTNLQLGLRLGDDPRTIVTTTPKRVGLIKELQKRALDEEDFRVVMTHGSTLDNAANLAATFLDEIYTRYKGTRLEKQELEGILLDDIEGALWVQWMLDQANAFNGQQMEHDRPVVAVDPPKTSGGTCGIVAASTLTDPLPGRRGRCGVVLGDFSASGSPETWAKAVVAAAHAVGTTVVVAESNQGGEMVKAVIRGADPSMRVELVHASKGKDIRAEPVSMLYEQRRVAHAVEMPLLDEQLVDWIPGDPSPDRLDALVWAMTHLLPEITNPPASIMVPRGLVVGAGDDPWRNQGVRHDDRDLRATLRVISGEDGGNGRVNPYQFSIR